MQIMLSLHIRSHSMVDIQVKNLTKFFVIGENLLENLSFEIQE